MSPESVRQAYSEWSATYDEDRNLTRDLDKSVSNEVLRESRCQLVVEVGCGTGKNTALLASIGARVLALDFSQEMIEKAKAKLSAANVSFEVADITQTWPCPDHSAELVTCNLVLEHIEGLSFVFAEAARVLSDGGSFFVCELHPYRQYQGVKAHFLRDDSETQIPAFVHHVSDFLGSAQENGLKLISLKEWWHKEDGGKPPRLISFIFRK